MSVLICLSSRTPLWMLREEKQGSFDKSTGKGIKDERAFESSKSECNQWEIIFEVLWVTSIIFKAEAHDYNQVIQKSIIIIITECGFIWLSMWFYLFSVLLWTSCHGLTTKW